MQLGTFHAKSRRYTAALALLTAILVLSIILFPERAFQSSLGGLKLWWNIVFPALLPFLMLNEILNGFGAVRGLGTLLEPLARYVLRLPGAGGWAIALGAFAGMPAGAEMAGKLRASNDVTREEGERILALAHVASPFFLLIVVGAGFMHNAAAGAALAAVHYASAIGTGLLLGWFTRKPQPLPVSRPRTDNKMAAPEAGTRRRQPLPARALAAMHTARLEDGRSFGKLLGDSVSQSIQTLMMIGGYMIFFSVLLGVLDTLGIAGALERLLGLIAPSGAAAGEAVRSALAGLLELNVGADRLSRLAGSETAIAACLGAALAWSGAAMHAQVMTAIRRTDLRYRVFLLARLIHSGLAFALTFVLWRPVVDWFDRSVPSFAASNVSGAADANVFATWQAWTSVPERMLELALLVVVLAVLSMSLAASGGKTARRTH